VLLLVVAMPNTSPTASPIVRISFIACFFRCGRLVVRSVNVMVDPTVGAGYRAVISAIADSLLSSLARPGGQLRAVLEPGLAKGVTHVALDRAHGEVKL
jgi:hypothetical protein